MTIDGFIRERQVDWEVRTKDTGPLPLNGRPEEHGRDESYTFIFSNAKKDITTT